MNKAFCRAFQGVMKVGMYFLPWHTPELIEGEGASEKIAEDIRKKGMKRVMIVTGPNMVKRGLMVPMLERMDEEGVMYEIFDKLTADPTDEHVRQGLELYKKSRSEGIVLFGGGSPMDCGKAIAACVARPGKQVSQLQGILKVRRRSKVPHMWAVPTTSGTGSEATMAAVITDHKTHRKKSINDTALIPHTCVLDPILTSGLPPEITMNTGMDALCHAVEAYTNNTYNTRTEKDMAKKAVQLIFDSLYEAYRDGSNMKARKDMQYAAFYAGRAFTRGCVGYVHAIGHTVGGLYGIPHGKAMAVILPHVLDAFGSSADKRLAELTAAIGIRSHDKAQAFREWLNEMRYAMDIPKGFPCIREEDIPMMAEWADKEANPLYPVPKVLSRKELESVIWKIKEA